MSKPKTLKSPFKIHYNRLNFEGKLLVNQQTLFGLDTKPTPRAKPPVMPPALPEPFPYYQTD